MKVPEMRYAKNSDVHRAWREVLEAGQIPVSSTVKDLVGAGIAFEDRGACAEGCPETLRLSQMTDA